MQQFEDAQAPDVEDEAQGAAGPSAESEFDWIESSGGDIMRELLNMEGNLGAVVPKSRVPGRTATLFRRMVTRKLIETYGYADEEIVMKFEVVLLAGQDGYRSNQVERIASNPRLQPSRRGFMDRLRGGFGGE